MTLSQNINDLEKAKFVETTGGDTSVRVTGDNFSGNFTVSGLTIGGRITVVTINNTTWTALPATPLANRNAMSVQNRSGQNVKLNYDNSVSGFVGKYLDNGFECSYDIKGPIVIYAKSETSACDLIVEEIA